MSSRRTFLEEVRYANPIYEFALIPFIIGAKILGVLEYVFWLIGRATHSQVRAMRLFACAAWLMAAYQGFNIYSSVLLTMGYLLWYQARQWASLQKACGIKLQWDEYPDWLTLYWCSVPILVSLIVALPALSDYRNAFTYGMKFASLLATAGAIILFISAKKYTRRYASFLSDFSESEILARARLGSKSAQRKIVGNGLALWPLFIFFLVPLWVVAGRTTNWLDQVPTQASANETILVFFQLILAMPIIVARGFIDIIMMPFA